jgi:asparagine N-glycosylation enzyme membrane subunit Stt3
MIAVNPIMLSCLVSYLISAGLSLAQVRFVYTLSILFVMFSVLLVFVLANYHLMDVKVGLCFYVFALVSVVPSLNFFMSCPYVALFESFVSCSYPAHCQLDISPV